MSLGKFFASIRYPIFGAPMANVSGSALAMAVSQAGGLGLIGGGYSTDKLRKDVLDAVNTLNGQPYQIGFGVLTFSIEDQGIIHSILRDVKESQKVSSIWLFGGDEEKWIPTLKKDFPEIVVIVQVHNVQAAQKMVECGADIIVAQGSDSGGHGGAESSSIISLVPEILKSCPGVPVLAAGGISDGQGIFAAMSLGAAGVVLGTRFMLSQESLLPQKAKEVACRANDGGRTTIQTRVYDEMRGTTDWPMNYTGRAIRNKTIEESLTGREEGELREDYKTAVSAEDYSRIVCWAGTGIGLVNDILPAKQIVDNLITEYNQAVQKAPTPWKV